jgi:hypothetical protein
MADILAISAAVVQFLDIAVRVSMELSSLYSDLRDVPGELRRLKLGIDQQIAIAKYIQSSHATFQSDSPGTSTSTAPINQTLADYMLAMDELASLLQSIRSEDGSGPLRRSWNAIRAVHKRKDVLLICKRLEHEKSSILLWLSNVNRYVDNLKINMVESLTKHTSELSFQIKILIEELQVNVDRTFHLTQKVEETSLKTDQQLREIPTLTTLSNATNLAISELTSNINSSQQQLLTATASTKAQVGTLLDQWQELAPTVCISSTWFK